MSVRLRPPASPSFELPARWRRAVPLRLLTTWRIGGPADFLSAPADFDELRADLALASRMDLPVLAFGAGSNLLFPDDGYRGLLVRLPEKAARYSVDTNAGIARFSAGMPLASAARSLARLGLSGLEWAEGIPGTMGGAIVNNAGAFGGCIAQVLHEANVLGAGGGEEVWPSARFDFAYRSSRLKGIEPTPIFILDAVFELKREEPHEIARRMTEFRARRAARTPVGPSCGSVFRNMPELAAGRLLEEAGMCGYRVGGAQVSTQHANYILNVGGATARDVLAVIAQCRERVRASSGIELELEVQIVGAKLNAR